MELLIASTVIIMSFVGSIFVMINISMLIYYCYTGTNNIKSKRLLSFIEKSKKLNLKNPIYIVSAVIIAMMTILIFFNIGDVKNQITVSNWRTLYPLGLTLFVVATAINIKLNKDE